MSNVTQFDFKILPTAIGGETVFTINARELHTELGVGKRFASWIVERIEKYEFVENQDFTIDFRNLGNQNGRGGDRRSVNYHISLDMAKIISKYENKPNAPLVYNYLMELSGDNISFSFIREKRSELKFSELLIPFCTELDVDVKTQVKVLNYRVDFIINDYILVEYDEKHHEYYLERDNKRQNEITLYMKRQGIHPIWVRVKEGFEPQGLAQISKNIFKYPSI